MNQQHLQLRPYPIGNDPGTLRWHRKFRDVASPRRRLAASAGPDQGNVGAASSWLSARRPLARSEADGAALRALGRARRDHAAGLAGLRNTVAVRVALEQHRKMLAGAIRD